MAKKLKFVNPKGKASAAPEPSTRRSPLSKKTENGKKASKRQGRKFQGRTSGLGVIAFQNKTLFENSKKKLTDTQLAKLWRDEFPMAIATYTEETVNGVRGLVNRGKHGNPEQIPEPPLVGYDENRQAIPAWGSKTREREAALAEKASAEKAAKKAKRVAR